MRVFSGEEIVQALISIPDWQLENGELARTFVFADFREAMSFVNGVADAAERAGHHPDIDIRYNKVRLTLSSHDAGGITERDFSFAKVINQSL